MKPEKNISLAEIDKFNCLASDWWDRGGKMKSLHDINPLRLAYIMKQTKLKGKRVLDVGCGGGILTESIARQGAVTFGIDASGQLVQAAEAHARQSGLTITYLTARVERLSSFFDTGFDVILCMELLEHVPDYTSIIKACAEILNPGGIIIFATINRNPISFMLAIVCAEYILGLLPKGMHDYAALIKPDELIKACAEQKLALSGKTGFSYNPFFQQYYFCKNTLVNYMASFTPC